MIFFAILGTATFYSTEDAFYSTEDDFLAYLAFSIALAVDELWLSEDLVMFL